MQDPNSALTKTGLPQDALVAIVGATATGKSDLAIALARELGGEVINADASQLYRGMDIGTAKVPVAGRQQVPHHQLDVLAVTESASVAAYQRAARADVDAIVGRGAVPILVGGSGLYVKSVLDPLVFPGTDTEVRARLEAEAIRSGPHALHQQLATVDPVAARAIPPANQRRVIRALEVVELTGRPFSATLPREEYVRPTVQVGLRRDPDELHGAIADRVHTMIDAGLIAEVAELVDRGLRDGRTARTALGYAQMLRFLDGELSLEIAVEDTITATRAFAKRQVKWFRRDPRITWLDAASPSDQLLEESLAILRQGSARLS